ncbi:MAG: hypothetical protein AAFO07_33200 [Bacteroidota bacterium]
MLSKDDFERMKDAYEEALGKAIQKIDNDLNQEFSKKQYSPNYQERKEEIKADRHNMNEKRKTQIPEKEKILQQNIFQDYGGSLEAAKKFVIDSPYYVAFLILGKLLNPRFTFRINL